MLIYDCVDDFLFKGKEESLGKKDEPPVEEKNCWEMRDIKGNLVELDGNQSVQQKNVGESNWTGKDLRMIFN